MTENDLIRYCDSVESMSGDRPTLGEAWRDFADAYGWELEENPYS